MFFPDINAYPWDAVVFVSVTFSDGFVGRGSGAMVGPNDILTAAHVVTRPGASPVEIDIFPAYNGSVSATFGSFTQGQWRTNYYTVNPDPNGNLSEFDSSHDIAIIGISQSLGTTTGYFGLMSYGGAATYTLAGYPAANGYNLVADTGFADVFGGDVFDISGLYHSPGSSGGPLFDSSYHIVGVCSTTASAARIDTEWNDLIAWINGNDSLIIIYGTAGNDMLNGTEGADTIVALAGADSVSGRGGNDLLFGNQQNDTLDGGLGNNTLVGGQDNDSILAGAGNDDIFGNENNDIINAGDGANAVVGGLGDDLITGGAGNDTLIGSEGNDTLTGGAGADLYIFATGSGNDQVNGFVFGQGDRLSVLGQTFTTQTSTDGDVVVVLSGGGRVELNGITPGAFSPSFVI